jgi:aromatic-L-amino-acid/L-tryptophan decarboxylase
MNNPPVDETLDPADWEAMRRLAHQAIDDGFDYLQRARDRPVWQPVPEAVVARLRQPAPRLPQGAESAYGEFKELVMPYAMGNTHPRFWSWFMGNGTPFAAVGDFLAAVLNPNMGGGNHVPNHVEAQVVDWCKEIVGFPVESSGLLVSGGSMANFVGLAVARNSRAGVDVRTEGVAAIPRALVTYASAEVHSCVQKAIESLGLGARSLRKVPVNAGFEIDVGALESMIAADRAGNRSASSAMRPPSIPGRPTTSMRSPGSANASNSGSTSTARSARCSRWRPGTVTWCAAWNARTPSRSTCTSGCTCRSRRRACWCAIARRIAKHLP